MILSIHRLASVSELPVTNNSAHYQFPLPFHDDDDDEPIIHGHPDPIQHNLQKNLHIHLPHLIITNKNNINSDPRTVTVCLEGLENILKVGEAEKNLGNTSGVNHYAQIIDEAGEEDEALPPADATQPGFRFGGNELPVPSGGFNFG
ncbi:hypothetical protein AAC387_Pa05g1208 [Persea americana]